MSHDPANSSSAHAHNRYGAHVVGHEVPEVEDLVHLLNLQDTDLLSTARSGDGELVLAVRTPLASGQVDEGIAELAEEVNVALSIRGRLRVLVIDLQVSGELQSKSSHQV